MSIVLVNFTVVWWLLYKDFCFDWEWMLLWIEYNDTGRGLKFFWLNVVMNVEINVAMNFVLTGNVSGMNVAINVDLTGSECWWYM